ncbi:LOW QUALITY PROTEIN: ATP synthase subunit C lysine N-methyltransferase [Osmia bicornis bicornis]|uniref:LOW QUALITY PROTEIN: ATP synthase subunit C lysine N-methyltransferase n=1 Tax=Osmia bicornis bicornis TaxID=1437191 RepID=UPI001EAEAA0D|nr:LOW QUALITY PROTEIN: ATP synthase subunit C lysine N-methyltransferase [Osmia bicornis bicornis]
MSEVNDIKYIITNNDTNPSQRLSKIGLYFIGITGGIATAISIICIPFGEPSLSENMFTLVPATSQQVKNVLQALEGRTGSLIDLGSGDGRIVFATAKAGFKAHGIELNPWLIWYSQIESIITGSSSKNTFIKQNLWKHNLKNYDNIVIFGMADVEKKFMRELKKDCVIVACRFPLPNMNIIKVTGNGVDTVWVYKVSTKI